MITVPKTELTRKSEGLAFALNYIKNDTFLSSANIEERVEEGKRCLSLLQQRMDMLEDERGLTHFAFGGFVHAIKQDDFWRRMAGEKYEDSWAFVDYCREILHMGASKANRLEFIYLRADKVGVKIEEIEKLGWPAAHKILQVAQNREDVDKWMEKFNDASTKYEVMEQLEDARRSRFRGSNESKEAEEERVRYNRELQFTRDQVEFFDQVVETAASRLGKVLGVSTSTRDCLLFILAEWRESLGSK